MDEAWTPVFHDPCTGDWQERWTLDGQVATVTNGPHGMDFIAGPEAWNNDHHAVLWTKQDFYGDVKIEFDYTRLDDEIRMVNIIYIQATGSGEPGYDKDIAAWADKRVSPAMGIYFNNMHAYHVSFAAFGTKNETPGEDYIRGRRYACCGLRGTEMQNEYERTGMFAQGVPHKMVMIKRDREIVMDISNPEKSMRCHLINTEFDPIIEGKIGLRHMYTRGARYKDIRISVKV